MSEYALLTWASPDIISQVWQSLPQVPGARSDSAENVHYIFLPLYVYALKTSPLQGLLPQRSDKSTFLIS